MSLWSLIVKVKGDNSGLKTTLNDSEKQVGVFGSAIKKLGGMLAAAFAVDRIVAFGKEASQLAAKAEGVRTAFQNIGGGKYIESLREATRGTVDDLRLMQAAVQANNFQIPLQSLASLFKFAADRAMQTGQSVDYLVDSIILGIGRKSPLILDNLGISAVRLREVLKGAGVEMSTVGDIATAVGKIATEEMSKMGDIADTTATKFAQLSTAWQEFKMFVGGKINKSEAIKEATNYFTTLLKIWSDEAYTFKEKLSSLLPYYGGVFSKYTQGQVDQRRKDQQEKDFMASLGTPEYLKIVAGISQGSTPDITNKPIETINTLTDKVEKLKDQLADTDISDKLGIKKLNQQIAELEKRIYLIQNPSQGGISPITVPGLKGARTAIKGTAQKSLEKDNFGLRGVITQTERELTEMEKLLRSGVDMASSLAGQLAESIGAALGSGNFEDIGKELLASFANFLSQFGSMLVAFGIANSAFYKSLTAGPLGGPIAVAAGTALLVAAGAIKGAMSKAASGGINTSSSYGNSQMQTIKVQVEGKVKGKDLGIVLQRNGY